MSRLIAHSFTISLDGNYFFSSDQFMFARAGIPSAFPASAEAYVGRPPDFGEQKWAEYGARRNHAVADEIEPDWDLSGAAENARWLLDAGWVVAQGDEIPSWNEGVEFRRRSDRPSPKPRLELQPLIGSGRGIEI